VKFQDIFFNSKGRPRSGWRLFVFVFLFINAMAFAEALVRIPFGGQEEARRFFASIRGDATGRVILLLIATGLGWLCGRLMEGLPFRALGWALHRRWLRDLLVGSLVGAASLLLAVAIAVLFGGYTFAFAPVSVLPSVLQTLVLAAGFFVIAGAAEEVLLRGYPLQTLLRSLPAWVPLVLTALFFSLGHLGNPNVVPGFTFVNTMLAGVWLAVAYLRTRSLWFPVGVHWAWNWSLGALFGLPVSGITMLSHRSLIQTSDRGPAWLTGGAYGIEGGAACTLALILSTVYIWRTRLVQADPEMKRLTDEEIPLPALQKRAPDAAATKEETEEKEETEAHEAGETQSLRRDSAES
jgi:hypothetical protein